MKDNKQYQKEKRAARDKARHEANREEVLLAMRLRWKNLTQGERDEANRKNNKRRAKRRKEDPSYRLLCNLRPRLARAIKAQGSTKDSTTMKLVGCSVGELISHLEPQFTDGMTWENYGEWHVDHMRPCASFDLTIDTEQEKCFHYTNLQPLWAEDNLRKSDKYPFTRNKV